MTIQNLRQLPLQVCLATMRWGWINGIACILCVVGGLAWLWAVPHLRAQMTAQQQALADVRHRLQSANARAPIEVRTASETNLAYFYDALGEQRYPEQQVKTLFAIAKKTDLILSQAEYRWSSDQHGRYDTYQILLPVKGSYRAVREFCEQTMLAIPFASLDELHFKRDTIANSTLDAKLRFTLYLRRAGAPLTEAAVPPAPDARS